MSVKRIFLLMCISFTGHAQVLKFDRAYEIGAAFGNERMAFDQLSENDWNQLTPGYESYKFIDTSFKQSTGFVSYGTGVSSLYFAFALKKANESEATFMMPMLRISLNRSSGYRSDISYSQNKSYVYDSVMHFSTGEVLYLDSIVTTTYRKSYYSSATNLMTNLLFHANRSKRWSFYLGVGLGFGLGKNAQTIVGMDQNYTKEYVGENQESSSNEPISIMHRDFNNKNYFVYHFNVPIGVDFRIKNNDKFYGRSVLSLEAQFGANWMRIPEVTNTQNTSFRLMFAYKYRL